MNQTDEQDSTKRWQRYQLKDEGSQSRPFAKSSPLDEDVLALIGEIRSRGFSVLEWTVNEGEGAVMLVLRRRYG